MELRKATNDDMAGAVRLAMKEYHVERSRCPDLIDADFSEKIEGILGYLFGQKYNRVALEDGRIIGFIAFEGPIEDFFGNVKGVFAPLGGSAFSGKDRGRLASRLYESLSAEMVRDNVCSHAISLYAHDEEIKDSFVMNGFGFRCSDAIMKLNGRKQAGVIDGTLEIKELFGEERRVIQSVRRGLEVHMYSAPIFFYANLDGPDRWYERGGLRVFAARLAKKDADEPWKEEDVIGFMSTEDEAETFVAEYDKMPNICGAFVKEEYRRFGVAPQILEYICQACEKDGMEYLGVDCETLNPTALRFWGKHFSNYTFSCNRRIDERIVGYEEYFNRKWPRS